MPPPLPKCNMERDSGRKFCYIDAAGSGPESGPPLVRCPRRYPKATYRYGVRASTQGSVRGGSWYR